MRPNVTMRAALDDPKLLGNAMPGETWMPWRALLIAASGEALTGEERALFAKLTGREREPMERIEEAAFVVGRRGGKSRAMATLAAYHAGLCDHRDVLVPGERGVALTIAPDLKQAAIIQGYATALFEGSPLLRQLIASRTSDGLSLTNGVDVEVRAASFRRLRGPTYIIVIADECAFFFDADSGSANFDAEILNAVRPGLATTGGPLVLASSPYAKRGELFETHRRHFGPLGDPRILVAQGASRVFNPSLKQRVVDRAMERDPAAARAEYLAEFREDISAFVARDIVIGCVDPGRRETPYEPGRTYKAFCDPSGGRGDSFVLAIGHRDGDLAVVDCLREIRAPFNPADATAEHARTLKDYGLREVQGDKFAGLWPVEAFDTHGVKYEQSAAPKSDLYRDLLPALNSGRVRLPDDQRLVSQLCLLERRTGRGRDTIDTPRAQPEDCANSIAGLVSLLLAKSEVLDYANIDALPSALWSSWTEAYAAAIGFQKGPLW